MEIGETKRKELEDKIDGLKSPLFSTTQRGIFPKLKDFFPPPTASILKTLDTINALKAKSLIPPPTASILKTLDAINALRAKKKPW